VVSASARLCGFLILLGVIFAAAYAAGARLGPVTVSHAPATNEQPMNMGGPAAPRPAATRR
jgi:hypothetical protein